MDEMGHGIGAVDGIRSARMVIAATGMMLAGSVGPMERRPPP